MEKQTEITEEVKNYLKNEVLVPFEKDGEKYGIENIVKAVEQVGDLIVFVPNLFDGFQFSDTWKTLSAVDTAEELFSNFDEVLREIDDLNEEEAATLREEVRRMTVDKSIESAAFAIETAIEAIRDARKWQKKGTKFMKLFEASRRKRQK